ncbi:MAG TPA: type II secretion system secretin GspD [Geothermobacteraceae bacterium]|nr:type II secretion system secretin GspD [Geothermobacteraceae bacterium]
MRQQLAKWLGIGLLLSLLLCAALPVQAAPAEKPAGDQISLDFKDVELTDLIQTISELTGKNFLYDESVKGTVTIISPEPMSLAEAYKLFLAVLNSKGYTVVPAGKAHKIVTLRDAKESNLPVVSKIPARSRGDEFITQLVPLQNVDAAEMVVILTPLIPKTSNLIAFAPSNTLVITDSAANIDRLIKIVHELDTPTSLDQFEILPLQYASADEVAKILNDVFANASPTINRRSRVKNVQTAGSREASKIIPYPRTNALVVLATPEDLVIVRDLVAKLDEKPVAERSNINVYYLENADAESLATTLNEIVTGIKRQATTNRAIPAAANQAAGKTPLSEGPVSITADKPTNALIINANPEDYETLKGIIARLDIKRKQVYVEALILELSMDATQALGVSLQGGVAIGDESAVFGTSNFNSGTKLSELSTVLNQSIEGLMLGGLFSPITVPGPDGTLITVPAVSALINLSKKSSDVNILSAPRLLTSDNEEAEIIVGSNVPIITNRLTDTSNPSAQSVAIERQDVALTLRFTPQVTEGNLVRLNVFMENNGLATDNVGSVDDVGPTLTKRQIRNTVLAEDGKTVVLGGLIDTNVQKSSTKVPLLGDLPLLGWLFKSEGNQTVKTNLLVFITPKVIRDTRDLAMITEKNRLASRALQTEALMLDIPAGTFLIDPALPQSEGK